MVKELTIADFVPAGTYSLQTLVNFGLLDLPTAVKVSGQELSTFDDNEKYQALARRMMDDDPTSEKYKSGGWALAALVSAHGEHPTDYKLRLFVVDSGLVAKLNDANVQISVDKRNVFGDGFSKIVAYNSALTQPILTDADGASPEFREALYSWNRNLDPFTHQTGSAERFAQAKPGDGLKLVWGLAAYMKESLVAGRSREEVSRVIDEKLGELLGWDSYFGTTPDTPHGRKIAQELSTVRTNSALVFENYKRISQFRDQFRDQIMALVDLYSGSRWGEKTQAYAQRMKQFLGS